MPAEPSFLSPGRTKREAFFDPTAKRPQAVAGSMTASVNVLVVMSDEQSWGTMGCTGNPAARTPHLDALCAESVSFDRCYTPFPLCCPSRASLWTGLMPRHHGVLGNWRPIEPGLREGGFAGAFAQHGYHTVYCGKWHVPGTTPSAMGWQDAAAIPAVVDGQDRGRYIEAYRQYAASRGYQLHPASMENLTVADLSRTGRPGHTTFGTSGIGADDFLETWQTREFLAALDRRPRDRPWLAACSFNAPHFPMMVPRPYDRLIDREAVLLPASLASGPGTKPREVRESRFARDFADLTETDWVELTALYLGLCSLVDSQLGRIVEYLRAQGEWERTIVVFTSDHGDMMGAHGLMEKGHLLHYEKDLRVPLFLRCPGEPGGRSDGFVSVCDIGPTLAELAGVKWEADTDGVSQADLLGEPSHHSPRQWVTAETMLRDGEPGGHGEPFFASDWTPGRDSLNLSVRTAGQRYVYRSDDQDELYDLKVDPHEQVNRAADPAYQALRSECRALLAGEIRDCFPEMAVALSPVAPGQDRDRSRL